MHTSITTVYYADPTDLVSETLIPLARELDALPQVDAAWLQSKWLFGPRVELHVRGENLEDVASSAATRIREYLAKRPSTRAIDADEYAEVSRQLGRLELVEPPYLPLTQDNTVLVDATSIVDTFIRSERTAAAKGGILADGLRVIADTVLKSGVSPIDAAFAGMTAIATAYPQRGLIAGYQAFLSHWKEYFYWADTDGRIEASLAASFELQRGTLVARLRGVHEDRVAAAASDPVVGAWIEWTDRAMFQALDLAEADEILPYPHPSRYVKAERLGEDIALQWSGSDDRGYSDFHAMFRQLDFTRLGNGYDFAAYRFVINSFFDMLPLLGISPIERYALTFYLTTAAQIVVDEPWQETIKRTVEQQAAAADIQPTLPWRGDLRG